MARWSYVGVEVSSGLVVEGLPLTGVKMSRVLNGYGSLSGSLSLRAYEQDAADRLTEAVDCGRRAIYALADGVPVWGGMSWTDGDQDGNTVSVTAAEWGSYFAKRVLRGDYSVTGLDQLAIAQALIAIAQNETGGNVGIAVGSETSGVPRDRTYRAGDLPLVNELLTQLGNVEGGFDWAWPVEFSTPTTLHGRLLLGYPRLGVAEATYVVKAPGSRIRGTSLERSAADIATTSWAVGKPGTDGAPVPVALASDPSLIAAGYPILDRVERYQDVSDAAILQTHADADQKANGGPEVGMKATIDVADYLDGLVNLGDPVAVERRGKRDGDGFFAELRVTQVDIDPERGTADLTLSPRITNGGRVPRPADDQARIAQLNREVRLLTTSR